MKSRAKSRLLAVATGIAALLLHGGAGASVGGE